MPSKNDSGQCVSCKEWCELGDPCCNAGVEFEGHIYHLEDFEEDSSEPTRYQERDNQIAQDLRKEGY